MTVVHKLLVRDQNDQREEWLTCVNFDTFSLSHSITDTSYQISFTANFSDETANSFNMLTGEAFVILDDQFFVVQQCTEKYVDNIDSKDVTATHIAYQVGDFHQYAVNKGAQDYSINSMLQFIFNSTYNQGFSFQTHGNFSIVSITDWGNCSGLDALQKAIDSYGAVWLPDNKVIHVYDKSSYRHQTNKQLIWSYNTSDIELSVDYTSIQNGAMLYGATVDGDHSTASDSSQVSDVLGDTSGNTPATPTGETTVGTVSTMAPGGAPVFSSPVGGHQTGEMLPNGSSWRVDKQVTVDGKKWYRVATNGWVSEDYLVFDKPGNVAPEEHEIKQVSGQGTVKAANNNQDSDAPDPISANLYDSPWTPQYIVRQLANGGQYLIDQEVDDGAQGKTWYRVATTEWIASDDMDFSGATDVPPKELEKPDDTDQTADTDETQYVFPPFFYVNSESRSKWGLHIKEDITNDQIEDVDAMRIYADQTMQLDPVVQLTVVENSYEEPQLGDVRYLNAEPMGIKTDVTVNSIEGNPFRKETPFQIGLDNSTSATKNLNYSLTDSVDLAHRNNRLLRKTVLKLSAKINKLMQKGGVS